MVLDKKLWLIGVSDLFINLSAGWFGAVFIIPVFSNSSLIYNLPILTGDLIMGILFLVSAIELRKKGNKYGYN